MSVKLLQVGKVRASSPWRLGSDPALKGSGMVTPPRDQLAGEWSQGCSGQLSLPRWALQSWRRA